MLECLQEAMTTGGGVLDHNVPEKQMDEKSVEKKGRREGGRDGGTEGGKKRGYSWGWPHGTGLSPFYFNRWAFLS